MMARLVIWVAVFMLFGSSLGAPKAKFQKFLQQCKIRMSCLTQLDMASNSVDDMYDKCEEKMKEEIEKKFLPKEQNENFKQAWNRAEKYYKSVWEKRNSSLKKEQIMALYAYSLDDPPLYREFNNAVRTQKSVYRTKFPYHTLHFFLTTALHALRPKADCVAVFRRTSCKFSKDVLGKEIRFSAFTSSSTDNYCSKKFGEESCFEITTCFGADISRYSVLDEREVLIPPYEVFKVTEIKESSELNELPCKVVYTLQSTKTTRSNLNCAVFQ